jgi:TonB-linked SusC/RagA family outer membrane protein
VSRWWKVACVVAGAYFVLAGPAALAQTGVVTGRVTDARSLQGVADATLEVDGTRMGAATDADGRFRIAGVPSGARTIIARRLGYAANRRTVNVAENQETQVLFALQPSAVALDQVVITGTAGAETRRAIGNAVATIDATDALARSAAPDLGSLLSARTTGVVISQPTGRLGAGPAIQIRGRSSIGLGNSPLIYVDGMRVNNATGTGPSGSGGLSGQNSSVAGRLNDIAPEDIETIEVIKGPAAATIYGTEASNGVIQIITKRGSVRARPQFSFQAQEGTLFFRDAEGRMPTNFARDSAGNIVPWNAVQQERERGTPLFTTGRTSLYNGSVSGGRNDARFYVSSSYENDQGIEPNNALRQFTLHGNVDVSPHSSLDLGTSLNYVSLRNRLGVDGGASAMFGGVFGHALLFPRSRGYGLGFPPEVTQQLWDNSQDVHRFMASARIEHRPLTWFRHRVIAGVDYTGDDSRTLERFAPPALSAILPPATAAGRIAQTLRTVSGITGDYSATATVSLTPTLSSSTSAGGQLFRSDATASFLGGLGFPGEGIETVSGAAQLLPSSQSQVLNTTIGAFAQQKFGWRERLYLTGALRVDNNSAFGEDFQWVTYPKVDLSWVISEEPFWSWARTVPSLRLRAAYGESGRQPNTFSALRTFTPVQGPGGANAVTPGSIGNPDLKPERGKELEVGFEVALLNRLTLDFTYFSKKTEDLIINQAVAPSSGFAGNRPVNLGRVDNGGIELLATAQLLTRDNVDWEIRGSLATNEDVIKDLGNVPSVITGYGQFNKVGYPIGGFFSKRVISADRDTSGRATNVLCDGGPGQAAVACPTAPFLFIGTPTPKTSGAIVNTLTIAKRLRLHALVDFKRGNRQLNATELLRCTGALGAGLCEANYRPRNYSPVYLAEIVGNALAQGIVDLHVQDASFTKLREISATYTLPTGWVRGTSHASISLAARELATWTNYTGIDPEVSSAGSGGATAQDQALMPPLTRYLITFNVRF